MLYSEANPFLFLGDPMNRLIWLFLSEATILFLFCIVVAIIKLIVPSHNRLTVMVARFLAIIVGVFSSVATTRVFLYYCSFYFFMPFAPGLVMLVSLIVHTGLSLILIASPKKTDSHQDQDEIFPQQYTQYQRGGLEDYEYPLRTRIGAALPREITHHGDADR